MKAEHLLFRIAIATLLLCSLSLGGLDQSGNINAKNMTISDFSALVPLSNVQDAFVDTGAPQATSADAGTEIAAYTEQAPPTTDLKKLMPSAVLTSPPRYMYYNGDYLAWNDFSTTFPSNNPGLWIERAVSWTFYATLPWGGWTRELIYVPQASPVTMYEIYPSGYVLGYNLGLVQPGYYYIWYYADAPDGTAAYSPPTADTAMPSSSMSILEAIISNPIRQPLNPAPRRNARKIHSAIGSMASASARGLDLWIRKSRNARKIHSVIGLTANATAGALKTRKRRNASRAKIAPGSMAGATASCRGRNRSLCPDPFLIPNPEPDPEPFNPAPNPVAECESNPGCQWADGRCNCMGLGGGIDNSNNDGEGDLAAAA